MKSFNKTVKEIGSKGGNYMVYPKHQIWRDKLGIGAGWQDPVHYPGFPKEELDRKSVV